MQVCEKGNRRRKEAKEVREKKEGLGSVGRGPRVQRNNIYESRSFLNLLDKVKFVKSKPRL